MWGSCASFPLQTEHVVEERSWRATFRHASQCICLKWVCRINCVLFAFVCVHSFAGQFADVLVLSFLRFYLYECMYWHHSFSNPYPRCQDLRASWWPQLPAGTSDDERTEGHTRPWYSGETNISHFEGILTHEITASQARALLSECAQSTVDAAVMSSWLWQMLCTASHTQQGETCCAEPHSHWVLIASFQSAALHAPLSFSHYRICIVPFSVSWQSWCLPWVRVRYLRIGHLTPVQGLTS